MFSAPSGSGPPARKIAGPLDRHHESKPHARKAEPVGGEGLALSPSATSPADWRQPSAAGARVHLVGTEGQCGRRPLRPMPGCPREARAGGEHLVEPLPGGRRRPGRSGPRLGAGGRALPSPKIVSLACSLRSQRIQQAVSSPRAPTRPHSPLSVGSSRLGLPSRPPGRPRLQERGRSQEEKSG